MSELSEELQSFIPKEYHILLMRLPSEILDSLQRSISQIDRNDHPYIQVIHALEYTVSVFTNPARELMYLLGRMAYYGSEYALLDEIFERYNHPDELVPFVARVLIFQNKFDEGLQLCDEIESKGRFNSLDPTTIFLYCETMLTRIYAPYFMGDFDTFDRRIEELSKFTTGYQLQKELGSYMSDVSIYEQILLMMRALRGGDPEGLKNVRIQVDRWIDSVNDLWIKGYFYNLSGISFIQNQEMEEGEKRLLKAMDYMDKVRDLRTYSAVGANLGTLLILEGRRDDGRKFIEEIIEPFVILGNYPIAMTHMLFVSKQYLDSNEIEKSLEYLRWAESLTNQIEVMEPATFSHFCYLYSKFRKFESAELYLEKLKALVTDERTGKIKEDADTYTLVWYYLSQAYYSSAIGNINDAEQILVEGIKLADKNKLYDSSLELTFLLIQTKLRKYILTNDENMIVEAIDILNDLSPLIVSIDNRYFNVVIHLIEGYLHATKGSMEEIRKIKDLLLDENVQGMAGEVENFFSRMAVLFEAEEGNEEKVLISKWMSRSQTTMYLVNEAIRLLNDLQFQHFEIREVEEVKPETLMIVQTNGITAYTHQFAKESTIDAHLISALLMAMSSFSKEVLGEGMLRKIEQDKHILLLDILNDENVIVLVVKQETYSIRKQFKRLVDTLVELSIADYLESGILLGEGDPQFQVIEDLVNEIFGLNEKSESAEEEPVQDKDLGESNVGENETESSISSDVDDGESRHSYLRSYLESTPEELGKDSQEDDEHGEKIPLEGTVSGASEVESSTVEEEPELIKAGSGIVRETPLTKQEEIYTGSNNEGQEQSGIVRDTPLTREEEIYTGETEEDENLPTFMKLEKSKE